MLTGGVGIGFFIWDAWNSSRLSDIIVALIYIGVVGFVLDRLVAAVGTLADTRAQRASLRRYVMIAPVEPKPHDHGRRHTRRRSRSSKSTGSANPFDRGAVTTEVLKDVSLSIR